MKRLILVGFCAMLVWNAAWSQPQLVKDIASAPAGIFGNNTHADGEKFVPGWTELYFPVTDQKGKELWRTDGTAEGTFRVTDANKGTADSYVTSVFYMGTLYFITKPAPGEVYWKLWKTQGTTATTQFIQDISIDDEPAEVRDIWVIDGDIRILVAKGSDIFLVQYNQNDNITNSFLINDDEELSFVTSVDLSTINREYVLQRFDGFTYESEVWATDGNQSTTVKLLTYPDVINNLTTLGQLTTTLFSNSQNQVLKIDHSVGPPILIHDFGTSTVEKIFPFVNNQSFVATSDGLWIAGATDATFLKDVININEVYIHAFKAYFTAYDESDSKYRIYETDGTAEGTIALAVIRDEFDTPYFTSPPQIANVRGKIVVPVTTPQTGMELATIADGEPTILEDINEGAVGSDAHMFQYFNEFLYFVANDGVNGMELWSTDGTPEGTKMVKNIVEGTGNGVTEEDLYLLNNEIYFGAYSSGSTHNVWRTKNHGEDAEEFFFTNSGTILGTSNDSIYMITNPLSVYKSSGAEDPILVEDLSADFGGAMHPSANFSLGDKFIYNLISFGAHPYGQEYWVIDSHTAGTDVLKNIGPGISDGVFGTDYGDEDHRVFVISDSKAIFAANDGANGVELWTTDGTSAGTTLLKDINPGSGSSWPRMISAKLGNLVFFSANDGTHGDELWSTDGTAGNTKLVVDLTQGGSSNITDIVTLGNAVYFVANLGLYKTTGTNATKITDVNSTSTGMIALNGKLYFGTEGKLWVSDGSSTEAVEIEGNPSNFYAFGDQVYFSAKGQLWHSKGTLALTRSVADIEPLKFKQAGDLLFMTASSKEYGLELFKMEQQKFTQDILFPEVAVKTFGDEDFNLTAIASSGLAVTYTAEGNVEITGSTVHITGAGPVVVTAHQAGDDVFMAAEDASQTFCVNPARPVVAVESNLLTSPESEEYQWYKDGVAIEGAIDQTYTATEDGDYSVVVTMGGCSSEQSIAAGVITGLGDELTQSVIYPNPVSDKLFLMTPGDVRILDSNGREAFNKYVAEFIDVSNFSNGMYVAIVNNTHFVKFIKK